MNKQNSSQLSRLLPNIPLIDSPLFPDLLQAGTFGLHQETARQLNQDGLAIIDLGQERMRKIATEIIEDLSSKFDLEEWRSQNSKSGLREQDAWIEHTAVQNLGLDPVILDILRTVYGREPFAFQTLNFPVGTQQHLHSDAIHFHSEPAGFMCGVWVPLEDIHPDSGPLIYVPGSHRLPYLQAHDVGYRQEKDSKPRQDIFHPAWQAMIEAQGLTFKTYTPKLGEALIWSANLLHGGSEVHDRNKTRWSQVTHYFFENCRHYTPIHSDWPHGEITWRSPAKVGHASSVSSLNNRQPKANSLSKLSEFDADLYLEANPDIAAAGMNPYEHLIKYGIKEGRRWHP